jgi:hypothetical protein
MSWKVEHSVSDSSKSILRPEPIFRTGHVSKVKRRRDRLWVVEALMEGEPLIIGDTYSTGLSILSDLKQCIRERYREESYAGERDFRSAYQEASQRLLAPIVRNDLALKKAPKIGWLKELYPDESEFLLPFPQVQGLNSSWQWYSKGIQIPVIQHRLHPYYGTYFPTRFGHLELLALWLERYSGSLGKSIDVGTGSGVISFQLFERGFSDILATDINPNAIKSVQGDLDRHGVRGVQAECADLLGSHATGADLIVFNPPWIPGETKNALDKAIYYPPGLFDRFFDAAAAAVHSDGRVVVLFSSLSQNEGMSATHPVRQELSGSGRFIAIQHLQRKATPPSKKTKRRKSHRQNEKVELWELKLSPNAGTRKRS